MRKLLLTLVFGLLTLPAFAQQGIRSHKFTIAGPDSAINLVSTSIAYHKLTWVVTGSSSVCTVALDSSTNGTTWSAGGAITGQTCTSNGSSTVVNVTANYVRINMTALTATAGSSVTVTWSGYTSSPAAGIGGSIAATQVAFGDTAANTIAGDAQFTWDSTNHVAAIGTTQPQPSVSFVAFPAPANIGLFSQIVSTSGATKPAGLFYGYATGGSIIASGSASWGYGIGTSRVFANDSEAFWNPGLGETVLGVDFFDGSGFGLFGYAKNLGVGTVTKAFGVIGGVTNGTTGFIIDAASVLATAVGNLSSGTITRSYGVYHVAQAAATNNYGAYFEDFGAGATTWALYSAGGKMQSVSGWLSSTTPPALTPGTSGLFACGEGTAPSVTAGVDVAYCDSALNVMKLSDNGDTPSQISRRVDTARVFSCGTSVACANTVVATPIEVFGTAPLSSGAPSTATLTGLPFTSSTSYVCTVTDNTSATGALLKVVNASGASTVITGPTTVTDVIGYACIGN